MTWVWIAAAVVGVVILAWLGVKTFSKQPILRAFSIFRV